MTASTPQHLRSRRLTGHPRLRSSRRPREDRALVDVLLETAAAHGDQPAIDDGSRVLSCSELIVAIRDLALEMSAEGIGPVGVRVPSGSVDPYLSILATMMLGAACVPVDVDGPDERARTVFAEAALFCRAEPLGPGDRVLAGLSVAFDAGGEEMWLAWRHGTCLVPAPRTLVKSGMDHGPWLSSRQITIVSTVPTPAALWPAEILDDLRLLIFRAEACPSELGRRLRDDDREVWNTYGPTEATVVARGAMLDGTEPVRIGLPLDGSTPPCSPCPGSKVPPRCRRPRPARTSSSAATPRPAASAATHPRIADWEARLRAELPTALVPRLALIEELPTKTSGKVDRNALPWPIGDAEAGEDSAESYDSDTDIAEQWASVLGGRPGSDADLFAAGGGSLAAAQVVSRLRTRHSSVTVGDIIAMLLANLGAGLGADLPVTPWPVVVTLFLDFVTAWGRMLISALAARMLMLGNTPGDCPRSGWVHRRLWLAEHINDLAAAVSVAGTPWVSWYAKLLGNRIGPDTDLHSAPRSPASSPPAKVRPSNPGATSRAGGSTAICCASATSRSEPMPRSAPARP